MAEGTGFEPAHPNGHTGFQDRLLKPLGHPSENRVKIYYIISFLGKNST